MKKKHFVLIFLFLLFGLIKFTNNVKGDYYIFNYLETDKMVYFKDEKIIIRASWELDYNIANEISYVQIQIFNNFSKMVWNSSKYDGIGCFAKNWTVNVQDLNIASDNYSYILHVKFYYFNFQFETMDTKSSFLDILEIQIIKRELSCSLINFTEQLKYGESLYFKAKFYDKLLGETSYLINQTISFKVSSNNLITYETNLTTNLFGIVEVNISSFPYLCLGPNYLILSLINNTFYNNTNFLYMIAVEKIPIFMRIINFNNTLGKQEDLKIKAFYYYYFNNLLNNLNNYSIQLNIYSNGVLKYQNVYKTSISGILLINISHKSLNVTQNDDKLIINLIFNGTDYLEKNEIVLAVKLNQTLSSETDRSLQLLIFSIVPVLVVLSTLFSLMSYNNKSSKQISLREITFKY